MQNICIVIIYPLYNYNYQNPAAIESSMHNYNLIFSTAEARFIVLPYDEKLVLSTKRTMHYNYASVFAGTSYYNTEHLISVIYVQLLA